MDKEVDIFKVIFNNLYSSLAADVKNCEKDNDRLCVNNIALSKFIIKDTIHCSRQRINNIRNSRSLLTRKVSNTKISNKIVDGNICDIYDSALDSCLERVRIIKRRLGQQQYLSDRRLRELIFEIAGEYGKSYLRIRRRVEFLRISGRIDAIQTVWRLRWEKLAHRLCYEATSLLNKDMKIYKYDSIVQYKILDARADAEEIQAIINILSKRKEFDFVTKTSTTSILKLSKVNLNQPSSHKGIFLARNIAQLKGFANEIRVWMTHVSNSTRPRTSATNIQINRAQYQDSSGFPATAKRSFSSSPQPVRRNSNNRPRKPLANLRTFLSANSIAWLHPTSFHPEYWDAVIAHHNSSNRASGGPASTDGFDSFTEKYVTQHMSVLGSDRLYYCLEERQHALEQTDLKHTRSAPTHIGVGEAQAVDPSLVDNANDHDDDLLFVLQFLQVDTGQHRTGECDLIGSVQLLCLCVCRPYTSPVAPR